MLSAEGKPNGKSNGKSNGHGVIKTSKKTDPVMNVASPKPKHSSGSKMSSHPPHMEIPEMGDRGGGGDNNNPFDVRNFLVPFVSVLSIVSSIVWFTWTASNDRSALDIRLVQLENKVTTLMTISERRSSIIDDIRTNMTLLQESDRRQQDVINQAWTAKNEILWCLKAQLINKAWRCPEVDVGNTIK